MATYIRPSVPVLLLTVARDSHFVRHGVRSPPIGLSLSAVVAALLMYYQFRAVPRMELGKSEVTKALLEVMLYSLLIVRTGVLCFRLRAPRRSDIPRKVCPAQTIHGDAQTLTLPLFPGTSLCSRISHTLI